MIWSLAHGHQSRTCSGEFGSVACGSRRHGCGFGIRLQSLISPLPAKPAEAVKEADEPVDQEALAARKAAYRRGIYVLIGLAVLTAARICRRHPAGRSVGLLFILILAKAGVILQYYMHLHRVWGEEAHSMSTESLATYQAQTKTNRIGLWLFFVSEAFMFGGLLASRFYLWGDTRPDLDQTLGLIVTSVLLLSSFFHEPRRDGHRPR